ncbi:MAG: hypothetical protein V4760_13040 [Bdellovibrionota bacterium]
MATLAFDSKEEYLTSFKRELETRGDRALSALAIQRAYDDAEEKFEILMGRGRTPTAVAETLGSPAERAEVVIAARLLKFRPGSETGPGLVTYLRVIRAVAIVAPVNLLIAMLPALAVLAMIGSAFVASVFAFGYGLRSFVSFLLVHRAGSVIESFAVAFQFVGVLAAVVFTATVVLYVFHGSMYLVWRWIRWNVNFLFQEDA